MYVEERKRPANGEKFQLKTNGLAYDRDNAYI